MKIPLIIASIMMQIGGAFVIIASGFSTDELLFIKGMLVVILGVQIVQDKELWQ